MSDSCSRFYLKSSDQEQIEVIEAFAQKVGVASFETVLCDDVLMYFEIECYERSFDVQLSKFAKQFVETNKDTFLRIYYSDEYGGEIFWVNVDGKLKKYAHSVESESAAIVKAYRHWHADMSDVWDGYFDREAIDRMSIQYGNYSGDGKKIKSDLPDYIEIVKSKKPFVGNGLAVPFAASKWNYHIPVFESYAAVIIAESKFAPVDKAITFERTFIILDEYDDTNIGYLWSWDYQGVQGVLLIRCIEGLSARISMFINHEQLKLDELIFFEIFQPHVDPVLIGNTQYIDYLHQSLYPPTVDYLYNYDKNNDWEKFEKYEQVFNLYNVQLKKRRNGFYYVEAGEYLANDSFDIMDADFVEEMRPIKPTPSMWFYLQVRAINNHTAHKVIKVDIKNRKGSLYKRVDDVPKTYQLLT